MLYSSSWGVRGWVRGYGGVGLWEPAIRTGFESGPNRGLVICLVTCERSFSRLGFSLQTAVCGELVRVEGELVRVREKRETSAGPPWRGRHLGRH